MKITSIILTLGLALFHTTSTAQEQSQAIPQEVQTTAVSNEELKQFANVYVEVQNESQLMQNKAVQLIEEEGMQVERFNELANAQNNPNQSVEPKEGEVEKLKSISTEIQKVQLDFQEKVGEIIQREGLTMQRYQEVYQAIQQDQSLQQKLSTLIQS